MPIFSYPLSSPHPCLSSDPGVWYLFKISVRTNAGWSPERFLWVETAPGPPTGPPLEVRASTQSSTRIRVTWKEPDEWKRNGPLAGYSVVYNPLNRRGLALVKNVTNPNQTRVILTDLKMFTEYEIRVRANGIMGPGPLSRPVMVKTAEGGEPSLLPKYSIRNQRITLPPMSRTLFRETGSLERGGTQRCEMTAAYKIETGQEKD